MITHTKPFGIYYWDTFDNETFLISEAGTLKKAIAKVHKRFKGRIKDDGADRVDIVDLQGTVVEKFKVG